MARAAFPAGSTRAAMLDMQGACWCRGQRLAYWSQTVFFGLPVHMCTTSTCTIHVQASWRWAGRSCPPQSWRRGPRCAWRTWQRPAGMPPYTASEKLPSLVSAAVCLPSQRCALCWPLELAAVLAQEAANLVCPASFLHGNMTVPWLPQPAATCCNASRESCLVLQTILTPLAVTSSRLHGFTSLRTRRDNQKPHAPSGERKIGNKELVA